MKEKNHILPSYLQHSHFEKLMSGLRSDNLNLTSTTGCQTQITSKNASQCTRLLPAPADLSTRGSETSGLELLTRDRCSQVSKEWRNHDFQFWPWGLIISDAFPSMSSVCMLLASPASQQLQKLRAADTLLIKKWFCCEIIQLWPRYALLFSSLGSYQTMCINPFTERTAKFQVQWVKTRTNENNENWISVYISQKKIQETK